MEINSSWKLGGEQTYVIRGILKSAKVTADGSVVVLADEGYGSAQLIKQGQGAGPSSGEKRATPGLAFVPSMVILALVAWFITRHKPGY